jgi:hypothetical protein
MKSGEASEKERKSAYESVARLDGQTASAPTNAPCQPEQNGDITDHDEQRAKIVWGIPWDRFAELMLAAAIAIATAVNVGVAFFQWRAANEIASKAFVSGQRAFVHLEGIDESIADNWEIETQGYGVWNAPKNLGKMIHSKFRLTNAGSTPTKNLQAVLHCELVAPQRVTSIRDPFMLLKWNDAEIIKHSIGAHQTVAVSSEGCDFKNPDVLLNAQMQIVPVFLIGYVKYEDWVEPGRIHKTQFAHRLIVHETGKMPGFEGMDIETEPVGSHNCTDEDCPN